jgi:hypothetical protein
MGWAREEPWFESWEEAKIILFSTACSAKIFWSSTRLSAIVQPVLFPQGHLLAYSMEKSPNRFLTFQVPNPMFLFRCLDRTGVSVQIRGSCKNFVTGYLFTVRSCYHLAQTKLEDHPLSTVRDCLFNIFAATLHTGGCSSIRKLRTRHAVVTWTH